MTLEEEKELAWERERESAIFRKSRIDRVNAGLKVKWRKQIDGWVIVGIGRRWNIYEWLSIVLHESDFFNAFFDLLRDKFDTIEKKVTVLTWYYANFILYDIFDNISYYEITK